MLTGSIEAESKLALHCGLRRKRKIPNRCIEQKSPKQDWMTSLQMASSPKGGDTNGIS